MNNHDMRIKLVLITMIVHKSCFTRWAFSKQMTNIRRTQCQSGNPQELKWRSRKTREVTIDQYHEVLNNL